VKTKLIIFTMAGFIEKSLKLKKPIAPLWAIGAYDILEMSVF
jgi:hypothetical protein